jgi:voltage-gated potassium channel
MFKFYPLKIRLKRYKWFSQQTAGDRKKNIIRLFVILLFLMIAHVTAMLLFEDLSIGQAIWLTLTTITTVGYGDLSAGTLEGRTATVVFLYLIGIFLLAQIAGEWIDYRIDRKDRMRKGMWRWKMKDHIVIINTPDSDGERYLHVLVEQIRNTPSLTDYPVQIFSTYFPDGLSAELREMGVVHHHGAPEGRNRLSVVDVEQARFVLVLAVSTSDYRADSLTMDILGQLRELHTEGHIIAECLQEQNRGRFRELGADAVLRPVRAYPEFVVRAMAAPGTEEIIEDLFTHQGAHPRRYDVSVPNQTWGELAARLLLAGFGTPIGYLDNEDVVVTNPKASIHVEGKAIFLMVDEKSIPSAQEVESYMSPVSVDQAE